MTGRPTWNRTTLSAGGEKTYTSLSGYTVSATTKYTHNQNGPDLMAYSNKMNTPLQIKEEMCNFPSEFINEISGRHIYKPTDVSLILDAAGIPLAIVQNQELAYKIKDTLQCINETTVRRNVEAAQNALKQTAADTGQGMQ
jgi:hypothetical protein